MSLNANLYKIIGPATAVTDRVIDIEVALIPGSEIFKGHFPGNHVVPGVALIDLSKYLIETTRGHKINITGIKNAKFLSVLSPADVSSINVRLDFKSEGICGITISSAGTIFSKISLHYQLKSDTASMTGR